MRTNNTQNTEWLKVLYFIPVLTILFTIIFLILKIIILDTAFNIAIFTWVIVISCCWLWALHCILKLTKFINITVGELEQIKLEVEQIRKDII
jgi:membrane protein YdbS with pleckstrin-like domain